MTGPDAKRDAAARFGTFGGVFTPCTLTILGVIMFLRFGQVIGNSGIGQGLLIVAMAKAITILTALSLSAIATNIRVKGGGAYYLISRSLGVEFGGAIGLVFYLSQAVSVALYVIGFTETVLAVVPALAPWPRLVATGVNVAVFLCVYIGAGWTIKIQYGILAILGLAVAAFVLGALRAWDGACAAANWLPAYTEGQSLWTMFALFFPAATGIMAGANMSGDLKDPARAIPRGTLAAILVTGIIYAAFAVLLGVSSERGALLADTMVVSKRALSATVILAGIFAATLSSALGSMLGAPRILQALARDKIFRVLGPFARGSGPAHEPRRAVILTFFVAESGILLGDLNAIAPVITMFFMITYGALNFATFMESFSGNPSYRPTFRWCHWSLALLGAVSCAAAMLLIDPLWALISILLMAGIHQHLTHQEIESSWGDIASGAALERVRRNLLRLEEERYHPKNWRPVILVLGAATEDRLYLAVQARWLCGQHGILLLGQVVVTESDDYLERHTSTQRVIRKLIAEHDLQGFPALAVAPSLPLGITSLIQCSGIGALRPNLVLLGWSQAPERREDFLANLNAVDKLGRSLALLLCDPRPDEAWALPPGDIDVWWLGRGNGELMLLLAHILQNSFAWRGRTVRLLRMIGSAEAQADTVRHLQGLADQARIRIQPVAVVGQSFPATLVRESRGAGLVILGLPDPQGLDAAALDRLRNMVQGLRRVLFVHSAGDMSLHG